jgi:hypothetical protein
MAAVAARHVGAVQRERILRALGVTPWRRRVAVPASPAAAMAMPAHAPCVLVVPAGCDARQLDLLARALGAFGAALARAPRIEVAAGELRQPAPTAAAYLAFGAAQAQALGRALPAAAAVAAQVVLLDEPSVLFGADAKRRTWNALKSLRRSLRAGMAAVE